MAVIYLKHAVHGAKVACSEVEAAYDETHGWVRFDVDPPAVVAVEPVAPPPPAPEPVTYTVTATNGMQPSNAMPKPRRRRSTVNADSE